MDYSITSGSQYATNFWNSLISAIPTILGALLILLISYIVAKGVAAVVYKGLRATKLNAHLHSTTGGNIVQRAIPDPTTFLSKVVYWIIFLFGLSLAVSFLGIPALVEFISDLYAYIPNILAALLIFLVAGAISTAVVKLIDNTMGDTATGKVVGTVAPVLVMVIAVFMILNQLMIAPEIVSITYAALIGSVALGMALAFGLGGREVAASMLKDLYVKGQQNKDLIARDFKQGATRAKSKVPKA